MRCDMWWCTCGTTHVQFSKIAAGKVLSCGTFRQAFFRYLLASDSPKVGSPRRVRKRSKRAIPKTLRKSDFEKNASVKVSPKKSKTLQHSSVGPKTPSKPVQNASRKRFPITFLQALLLKSLFRSVFEIASGKRFREIACGKVFSEIA